VRRHHQSVIGSRIQRHQQRCSRKSQPAIRRTDVLQQLTTGAACLVASLYPLLTCNLASIVRLLGFLSASWPLHYSWPSASAVCGLRSLQSRALPCYIAPTNKHYHSTPCDVELLNANFHTPLTFSLSYRPNSHFQFSSCYFYDQIRLF